MRIFFFSGSLAPGQSSGGSVMIKRFLLALLAAPFFFWVGASSATVYPGPVGGAVLQCGSNQAGCPSWPTDLGGYATACSQSATTGASTSFVYYAADNWGCYWNGQINGANNLWSVGYVGGSFACPTNAVFNSTTGSCDASCTAGTVTQQGTWNTGYNSYAANSPLNAADSSGTVITVCTTCASPTSACMNGCTVNYTQTGSAQVTDSYGTANYSTGQLTQSGAQCSGNGGAVLGSSPIAQASGVSTTQAIANNTSANASAAAASSAAAVDTAAQQAAIDAGASASTAATLGQQAAAAAAGQAAANNGMANPMIAFCADNPQALACQNVNNDTVVADPTAPDLSTMSSFDSAFSGLRGWQLPAHTSTCPAPVVDLSSIGLRSYTIDAQCTIANQYFGALASIMAVVYSIIALFIVLRA